MSVQVQTSTTNRFKDWARPVSWWAFGAVAIALIISPFLQNRLIDKRFSVVEEEPFQSDLIQYKPGLIGALRVDAKARLPANRWVTYELQILDESGVVLASGLKQAWRDTGTWSEGGESGSWDESDTQSGFALKTKENQPQTIRVAIQVLEAGTTTNSEWNGPVNFTLSVHDGSIDIRYMWMGFFGTLAMAFITSLSGGGSGQTVISKSIDDSDIGDRATLGGPKNLIQVEALIDSDETTPQKFNIELIIRNADGDVIYRNSSPVNVRKIYDEGTLDGGKAVFRDYFLISPRASYGFYLEATPDQSIDRTRLVVKENFKSRGKVTLTQINDSR